MNVPAPTIGCLVHYALSASDAASINTRRADYKAFEASHVHPHEAGHPGASGHVAHYGNHATEGDLCPAMVVRTFGGTAANLQVFLDGNDVLWVTSRNEGTEAGTWRWPERA